MSLPVDGRQARGQAKRAKIVDAAAGIALQLGVVAVSHRAVAAAAGVPLGSTTYHFATLDDLRAAAVERLFAGDRDRRAEVIGDGRAASVPAEDLAWALIDLVIGAGRLDDPAQVALLYERIAESARAPELAAVIRAGQLAVEADAVRLVAGTPWADLDGGTTVSVVDGRAIGWLALGAAHQHELVERVAHDLRAFRPVV